LTPNEKSTIGTLLLGFIGVPLLLTFVCGIGGAALAELTAMPTWLGCVLLVIVTAGLLWFFRGRADSRPESWGRALLPVVIPPAYYLLAWVVTFEVTGWSYGDSLNVSVFTHAPYVGFLLWVLFFGPPQAFVAVLLTALLASVGGYLLGARQEAAAMAGRRVLIWTLVGTLLLSAVAGAQIVQAWANSGSPGVGVQVGQEVDLSEYEPFREGNRLVVPEIEPTLKFTEHFPRLDGATAAYPVYAAMGQALYDVELNDDTRYPFIDNYLTCSNTSGGYDRLISGEADVFFGAQPSKGQQERAAAVGRELELTAIGHEAFVIFVNQDNPVSGLTTAQVQDIYTKKVTNWSELGGRDEKILAFQRPEDSGSQTIMQAKVMQGVQMAKPMREETVTGMGGVLSQVAEYRNSSAAIGYSFRWYATVMNGNPGIKLLAVDGVQPTVENIRNGTYPLTVDLYAVTAGTNNTNVPKLLDWVVSAEGQKLIEQVGYVGLK